MINKIDALLPQTQCGLCGYGGCRPYAEAMLQGEAINRCPPGGVTTLKALAELLHRDATPFLVEMSQKEKPHALAQIRETECIGCTKCIQACPVDAIVGSAKQMHTILIAECTGCELCVAPCPVDCIDIITIPEPSYQPDRARQRFNRRKQRLNQQKQNKQGVKKVDHKQAEIAAAVARAKAKKAMLNYE